MARDDAREATEAAIEQTHRERVDPDRSTDPDYPPITDAVEWEVDGARFSCFRYSDGTEELRIGGNRGRSAFEVDLSELRGHLERFGVFEADVTVLGDDLEWFPQLDDRRRADGSPTSEALQRIHSEAAFEYLGQIDRPGVRAVVDEYRETVVNGTAVAGEFGVGDDDLLQELWELRGLEWERDEVSLGLAFLRSGAVEAFLDDATPESSRCDPTFRDGWEERGGSFVPVELPEYPLSFRRVNPSRIDGVVAERLLAGGAYAEFGGDYEEAKGLGRAFSHAFRDGERSADQFAYECAEQWSNWFVGTNVYDTTLLLEDRAADRIRLFLTTTTP